MYIDYYSKQIDQEHREELKKWVYLDRSRFTNYKQEIELLDGIETIGQLIGWIKDKTSQESNMSGLPRAALTCILHSILIDNYK